MCIYRNSFGVNAIINSNKICICYNIKVLNCKYTFIILKSSFIEVYESDKLEFESETLTNYAPPNNSSPSTFIVE